MASQAVQDRSAYLIAQATILNAEVAAVCAQSRALIERGRQRRRASPLRVIRGGSDAAMVATVLGVAPLCQACIAKKTGVPGDIVDHLLSTIGPTLQLAIGPGRCHVCLEANATTYRLAASRPAPQQDGFIDKTAVLGNPLGMAPGRWGVIDAEGVLALIIRQSLCVPCIVEQSGIIRAHIESILAALGETLGIRWMLWSCAACHQTRDVFRLR